MRNTKKMSKEDFRYLEVLVVENNRRIKILNQIAENSQNLSVDETVKYAEQIGFFKLI